MAVTGPWRLRARTAEAAAALLLARLLVAAVPFRHWLPLMGRRVDPAASAGEAADTASESAQAAEARRLARHVERAAGRRILAFKCLPKAMALQFMLRRRGISSTLLMGILPAARRGTIDDLHAWVVSGNQILIGRLQDDYRPLVAVRGI